MTKFKRTAFTRLLLSSLLALAALLALLAGLRVDQNSHAALPAREPEQHWTILLDDFAPQPLQGQTLWPYNRLGGERGQIFAANGVLDWGPGAVTASITSSVSAATGVWTSLNHPLRDHAPLDFAAIFPSQIISAHQGRIMGLRVETLDGSGTLAVELKAQDPLSPAQEIVKWSRSVSLSGGPQSLHYSLPVTLGEVQNLNWLVSGTAGDFVVVDQLSFTATLTQADAPQRAFLWSYAMLLNNWDPASGLTRDSAYPAANEFDNVSASGMQAAAAALAWQLGFISQASATEIVSQTAQALLALPRCHGLWPHFVRDGQISAGTEWSSIDSIIALAALLEAQQALGLDTAATQAVLEGLEWDALRLGNGSLSMGYDSACSQRLEDPAGGELGGWQHFGTESWLVNLAYAAATGQVSAFDHSPPTFNGSGFIDELAWLLVPPPASDWWGTAWTDYRQQAADCQLAYYQPATAAGLGCQYSREHQRYSQLGLFGLSAAEVPDPASVAYTQTYRAFGVGGETPPDDGADLLGQAVVVPHYAGLVASLRPSQALNLWNWLETEGLYTPLNAVESLYVDEATGQSAWNALKGSWNLSLQALGWGRLLAGDDNPLYGAMWANDALRQGYESLQSPPCGPLDGVTLDRLEALGDWYVVTEGATAPLTTTGGYAGRALQLDYDLGATRGAWAQLRRDFDPPLDLSAADHLRLFYQGTATNTLEIGLVAADGNYFGPSWNEVTQTPWWTYATWDLQGFRKEGQPFPDLGQVEAIFLSVVNTTASVGGQGAFIIDQLEYLTVATRSLPSEWESPTATLTATQQAVAWISAQQQPGGLLKSWQQEESDYAWLYDQALGLLALADAGYVAPADQLAAKLAALYPGDCWYTGYHYLDDTPLEYVKPIGANAWLVYAAARYDELRGGSTDVYSAALQCADWLAAEVQRPDGSFPAVPGETGAPTEPNLDAWWALWATGHYTEAQLLQDYLLDQVWDDDVGRFKAGPDDYQIFLDNQTWGAALLRALGRPDDARRALSYARWTLAARSGDGGACGFDGAGPFSVWNEGTLQYVSQGGAGSQHYWEQVVAQQALDGGVPGSPDSLRGYIVWLTPWRGIAPTAWLYFAGSGGPFQAWLNSIEVSGPSNGLVHNGYTFSATVSPGIAAQPITYTWQATRQEPVTHTGGLSDSVAFTWHTTGTQTITVTARNAQGAVSATHSLRIFADKGVVKSASPSGTLFYGDELTYTLLITGQPGAPVALYDPLQGASFVRFVEQPGSVTYDGQAVVGELTLPTEGQASVNFVARAATPVTAGLVDTITNRACVRTPGSALDGCIWSKEVNNTVIHLPDRDCYARVGNNPITYTIVQEAIDAAQEGDEVKVVGHCQGVSVRPRADISASGVVSQVAYISKTITLRGGYTVTNWTTSDPARYPTTLDGGGQGRIFYITGNVKPTIEGLILSFGSAMGMEGAWLHEGRHAGGSIYIVSATATISGNLILDSMADYGSVMYVASGAVILDGNYIESNVAFENGGILLYKSTAKLNDNTIVDNQADFGDGAGLLLIQSNATLNDNTIYDNSTMTGFGGGLAIRESNVVLNDNTFFHNSAAAGGGMWIVSSTATLHGNVITQNFAVSDGGGLHMHASAVTLEGNTISENVAELGAGLYAQENAALALNGNTVVGNQVGGGLVISACNATLDGNRVSANLGGGIFLYGSDSDLTNNIISDHQDGYAGIHIQASAPRLRHTTLARNTFGLELSAASQATLVNTILVSHTVGVQAAGGSTAKLRFTLWGLGAWANERDYGGAGDIRAGSQNTWDYPAFVAPGDYHIGPGSAAREAGVDAGVLTDIDGQTRPYGSAPDLGADECVSPYLLYLTIVLR